jgi:TetR/AcrR family transcriptional repressor of nem operon
MSSEATKNRIIEEGARIVHSKGFRATGIQEVLDAARVPKGSFYFYFRNKSAFGLALIEYFEAFWAGRVEHFLTDSEYTPLLRLARLFGFFHAMFEDMGYKEGCPIGNMAQEMADQSEEFRLKINDVMQGVESMIAICIKEGQDTGEIRPDIRAAEAASFILNAWEGAMLRMKTVGGPAPLRNFEKMVFEALLVK